MNGLRINNHYVPECYLKHWQGIDGKVYIYKTLVSHQDEREWRKRSVAAIAYHKHFYTQVIAGKESDKPEHSQLTINETRLIYSLKQFTFHKNFMISSCLDSYYNI